MDLCIDARMISSGGIGTVLKNLIPPLSCPPFRTTLIVPPSQREKWPGKLCCTPIYSIHEQFALPRLISKCDLFWSPHYNVPIFPIRAKKRIVTIHDVCHLAFSHLLSWKERLYAKTMLQQAVHRSDLVLTDSFFSQGELCKYFSLSPQAIRVIYPGIDFDRFAQEKPTDELRKKYALPSSFFLFVGNVKPHKNLRLILDVYEKFSIELPLVVVGKVKGLLNFDRTVQHKKILFFEEVLDEELPAFYQMAKALIFPSLYEGFGLPPLEAMAAGCPAIVSNRASLPEVCGNAAYFIDPTQSEGLAQAMLKITTDRALQNELKQKGKVQARKFSWEYTAKEYSRAFQEVLS